MNRKTRKHEQAKKVAKERLESELLRLFLAGSLPPEMECEAGRLMARAAGRAFGEFVANNLRQYLERQQEAFPIKKGKKSCKKGSR